jgi:hypothetical protein
MKNKNHILMETKEELKEALENQVAKLKTDEEKLAHIEKCMENFREERPEESLESFCLDVLCEFFDTSLVVQAHQNLLYLEYQINTWILKDLIILKARKENA